MLLSGSHEHLSHGVVDLVSARVGQLFSLEPDVGSADLLAQVLGEVKGGGATDELSACMQPVSRMSVR